MSEADTAYIFLTIKNILIVLFVNKNINTWKHIILHFWLLQLFFPFCVVNNV